VGSPKWLIEVRSAEALARVRPDMAALEEVSCAADVNGAYVFVRVQEPEGFRVLARGFNPRGGVDEDAATGVAAAALASLLHSTAQISRLVIDQGIELKDLNRIDVRVSRDEIRVGGRVTFETEETFP
jgi:trans-2,3-dihydro-3-hydroxyanthranilate isomerase